MNLDKRMISMARRRNPETEGKSDEEIHKNLKKYLPETFKKGFKKTASPMLVEQSSGANGSEHTRKSQAILEASYNDNGKKDKHLSKEQKNSGKAVKEGPNLQSTPNTFYNAERR